MHFVHVLPFSLPITVASTVLNLPRRIRQRKNPNNAKKIKEFCLNKCPSSDQNSQLGLDIPSLSKYMRRWNPWTIPDISRHGLFKIFFSIDVALTAVYIREGERLFFSFFCPEDYGVAFRSSFNGQYQQVS